MRVDRRVSPNQTALWSIYQLHHRRRSVATFPTTSQQHAPVNRGQLGHPADTLHRRSAHFCWSIGLTSKLVMRVDSRHPLSPLPPQVKAGIG
jgi:hypothetical protein